MAEARKATQDTYEEKVASYTAKLGDYGEEYRDGVFQLVISLIEFLSNSKPKDIAKEEVATWLEELAQAIRSTSKKEKEEND